MKLWKTLISLTAAAMLTVACVGVGIDKPELKSEYYITDEEGLTWVWERDTDIPFVMDQEAKGWNVLMLWTDYRHYSFAIEVVDEEVGRWCVGVDVDDIEGMEREDWEATVKLRRSPVAIDCDALRANLAIQMTEDFRDKVRNGDFN